MYWGAMRGVECRVERGLVVVDIEVVVRAGLVVVVVAVVVVVDVLVGLADLWGVRGWMCGIGLSGVVGALVSGGVAVADTVVSSSLVVLSR